MKFPFMEPDKNQYKSLKPRMFITWRNVITMLLCTFWWQAKVAAQHVPNFQWEYASPENHGMSAKKLDSTLNILAERNTKKLLIVKNDKIVYEWFSPGFEDSKKRHYTASLAKALVSGMSLLAAIDDDYIYLDEPACNFVPVWKTDKVKSKITIRQLADHTSGILDAQATEKESRYLKDNGLHHHFDLPGWRGSFWKQDNNPFVMARDSAPLVHEPGTAYRYSNPGIAMLNYAVTASLTNSKWKNIREYLEKRVFEPIGIDKKEYSIGYGRVFGESDLQLVSGWGGGSFTARAVARIGRLMLHKGNWQGRQIIDSSLVEKVIRYSGTALPHPAPKDSILRGYYRTDTNSQPVTTPGWYSNQDGVWANVPRDAFSGAGAGGQHLMVIPSLNMLIVRMGGNLNKAPETDGFWLAAEKYIFNPIMDAILEAPYPKSDLTIEFAPKETIVRMAEGGDNWPSTWADDGHMYTAYGDGNGFLPRTDIKLSLGLARVEGNPPLLKGYNIRSRSGESVGQGRAGTKASGILMVDGVLYMLVRNIQNSKLMWSADYGNTWQEANRKFDESFGCPTFLNYGKNYQGAIDDYVYIYSHDEDSAYNHADHQVLARIKKNHIKDWSSYEYFTGYDNAKNPTWSEDIRKRKPVFTNPGKSYRSGITYNEGLKKFLWCQPVRLSSPDGGYTDVRFKGGLGIFESDNPWGPWKTVFYTRQWDVGPGETVSIPSKWISEDGRTCYLLFSGDDSFSVRKFTIDQ